MDYRVREGVWAMYCQKCGKQMDDHAAFCPHCGAPAPGKAQEERTQKKYYVSSKSRTLAMVLAAIGFLGISGLHRLYVGKKYTAFLYLVTFGGFFIGTIWDLYQLYDESFKDGDGYPLYSDDSIKSNYRRRRTRASAGLLFKLAYGFFCLIFLSGSVAAIFAPAQRTTQVADTENVQQQARDKKAQSKEEREKRELPIIDLPMNRTPEENIKNTVEKNFNEEGNTSGLKLGQVKVDSDGAGGANVTIAFQGARGLTVDRTLAEFNYAIKKEIAALYQIKPGTNISNVTATVYMKTTDKSMGNEETIPAYTVSMNQQRANGMHWENYKKIDIMDAASDIKMHPSFKYLLQKNANKSGWDQMKDTFGL